MTPAIEFTSVPAWAIEPRRAEVDPFGRYWTLVAVGASDRGGTSAVRIVEDWVAEIGRRAGAAPRVYSVSDDRAARDAVTTDLTTALVGWRLMIAGPADACLRLRAHALAHGVGDDEISVATTEVARRDVHCAHCRTVTGAEVALGELVTCAGCGRRLAVQSHVSRRLGAHLGVLT